MRLVVIEWKSHRIALRLTAIYPEIELAARILQQSQRVISILHRRPRASSLNLPTRVREPPRLQVRHFRIRIVRPRERGPGIHDELRHGNIMVVAQGQAIEDDRAEGVVKVSRVTFEILHLRIAVRISRFYRRLAYGIIWRVVVELVGSIELVVVDFGEDIVFHARVRGGLVEAAEFRVCRNECGRVEDIECFVWPIGLRKDG